MSSTINLLGATLNVSVNNVTIFTKTVRIKNLIILLLWYQISGTLFAE